MVLYPLKIQEKNSKKVFFPVYPGTKSPFLEGENFSKTFLAAVTTFEKKRSFNSDSLKQQYERLVEHVPVEIRQW